MTEGHENDQEKKNMLRYRGSNASAKEEKKKRMSRKKDGEK